MPQKLLVHWLPGLADDRVRVPDLDLLYYVCDRPTGVVMTLVALRIRTEPLIVYVQSWKDTPRYGVGGDGDVHSAGQGLRDFPASMSCGVESVKNNHPRRVEGLSH